jgi:hypothetical protein
MQAFLINADHVRAARGILAKSAARRQAPDPAPMPFFDVASEFLGF